MMQETDRSPDLEPSDAPCPEPVRKEDALANALEQMRRRAEAPDDAPHAPAAAVDAPGVDPLPGDAAPADAGPTSAPPTAPRKRRTRLVAALLAGVAVLAIAAVFAVPAILRAVNPKAYLAGCMASTLGGYSSGAAAAVLGSLGDGPSRQSCSVRVDRLSDSLSNSFQTYGGLSADDLPGTGFDYTMELDPDARQAYVEFPFYRSGAPVVSLSVFADDALISFGSEELTGGNYYCLNTETLGRDVLASPIFGSESTIDPDYGFNLFALLGDTRSVNKSVSAETKAALDQLLKVFDESVTVDNLGSAAAESLGRTLSCSKYRMTLPADALRAFLPDYLETLLRDEGFLYLVNFQGFSPEGAVDAVREVLASLEQAVTVDFYLSGGRVVLLDALMPVQQAGRNLECRFTLECDGHSALAATLVLYEGSGISYGLVFRYTRDGNDFILSLAPTGENIADAELRVTGSLTADAKAGSLSLKLTEISFIAGEDMLALSAEYSAQRLDALTRQAPENPTPFLELDEEGYYQFLLQYISGMADLYQSTGLGAVG